MTYILMGTIWNFSKITDIETLRGLNLNNLIKDYENRYKNSNSDFTEKHVLLKNHITNNILYYIQHMIYTCNTYNIYISTY